MHYTTSRLTLELQDQAARESILLKQGDSGRRVCITLTSGGFLYEITPECTAVLTARTAAGEKVYADCRIRENHIYYTVTPAVSGSVGVLECEIKLYSGQNSLLTTPPFLIQVEQSVFEDRVETPDAVAFRVITLELPVFGWLGERSPFAQGVEIPGISAYSKIDLQPDPQQLEAWRRRDLAFTTENRDGRVTVFAVGDRPEENITVQATVTEVRT